VILQEAVFATVVAVAEAAVPHDALGYFLAVLEGTSQLLRSTTTERRGEVYGGIARDMEIRKRAGRRRREVFPSVYQAEVGLGE